MLKAGGKRAFVCGNLGDPLIEFCDASRPEDYYVVELSSFQLETIHEFRAHIAAIINLAEDHLDRYPSVEPYFQAKMRIFENQKASDFAVSTTMIRICGRMWNRSIAIHFWFSRKEKPPSGVYSTGWNSSHCLGRIGFEFYTSGSLKGVHNLENTLCAASIGLLCGILPKAMQQAAENFTGSAASNGTRRRKERRAVLR